MGFRNPITSAAAVDTGQPAGAGARLFEGSDAAGVFGVLEFRDGIADDAPATITGRANLVPQGGGGYTAQGGALTLAAGSFSGATGPTLALKVESLPAGGYGPVARLAAASGIALSGPLTLTGDGPWTDYAPAWQTGGGSPSLGAGGSVVGRWRPLGRLVAVEVFLSLGTAPNGGTGAWSFALPTAAAAGRDQYLTCKAFCTGLGNFAGFGVITSGAGRVAAYLPNSQSDCRCSPVQNANAAGTAGTGVPLLAGGFPFSAGSNLALFGLYEPATS